MKAYEWAETLEVERHGELVLDAIFAPEFIVVRATKYHQRQKMDRFLIKRRDGRVIHRADYKVDRIASRSGNLPLEHVSVERNGIREAKGWLHVTIADLVVFYVPELDTAFVLEIQRLRQAWDDILRLFPVKSTSTPGTRPYRTLNCCVPIAWLRQQGLIKQELEAVGVQLRLNLTVARKG